MARFCSDSGPSGWSLHALPEPVWVLSDTHVRWIGDSELFLRVSACLSLDVSPMMNCRGLTLGVPGRLPYDSCERRAGSAGQAGIENGRRVLESLT